MPILQVHLLEGRSRQQKAALARALTDAVVTTLNADPQTVRVILSEMKGEDYAVAGTLFDELPTRRPPAAAFATDEPEPGHESRQS